MFGRLGLEIVRWFRRGAVLTAGAVPLLLLAAERAPLHPAALGRTTIVQGRHLVLGAAPIGAEDDEGSQREQLARWFDLRHRTARGVDWRAIEERNRRETLRVAVAEAKAPQPVWRERGPINTTGSSASTAIAPDGRTLLVATSQGGVFSGIPGTAAWRRVTDSLGGYSRGFLVSPRPEIWVAGIAGSVTAPGRVYASRNRGATWAPSAGLPVLLTVYELLQDGGDPRTIYLAARAADSNAFILARSKDGGLSFGVVFSGRSERAGIWTSRTGAGPLYLLSNGQLYRSTDQGTSFAAVGSPPLAGANFALLRGSEAGAPTLYAVLGANVAQELFVSQDGGASWEGRYRFPATYPLDVLFGGALATSRRDPNLVLFGNQNAWRSTDGGRSFAQVSDWQDYYDAPQNRLHADINGLQFVVYKGQEVLLLNTDGGTYLSTDGGATVKNLTQNGLPDAQFYSTWSSATDPNVFLAGAQDQGLQLSLSPGPRARPGVTLATAQLISGDYAGLTAAAHGLQRVFGVYPAIGGQGFVILFQLTGNGGFDIETADLPLISENVFFQATAADPSDPNTVYVGGDTITRVTYLGGSRFAMTPLPHSFSGFDQDYVTALAVAPANGAYLYAATFNGHLWYSHDRGATWTESATTQSSLPESVSNSLLVATHDPLTCYAGGSGYGTPPVLVTHDGGATWSSLSNGLPGTLVWSLAFDDPETQTLYAATESGPYVYDGRVWRTLLGGGAPLVRYFSVEGVPVAKTVRFGTYGRGVWDYLPPPKRR